MRVFIFLVTVLAALVSSQPSVDQLPTCAIPCINSAIAATGCQAIDVHCFCTATAFLETIAPCIFANCSVADQQATQTIAQSICNAASPPVQLPSFQSLLNMTNSSTTTTASRSPTSSVTNHSGASGRIEGDMRIMMALAAMVGIVVVAFFAV